MFFLMYFGYDIMSSEWHITMHLNTILICVHGHSNNDIGIIIFFISQIRVLLFRNFLESTIHQNLI